QEVAAFVRDPAQKAGKDYIIVDVHRTDFEVFFLVTLHCWLQIFMVRTAINIPAQSLYPARWTWLEALGKVPIVIFYCSSSNGRGPRCAGWFQDTLDEAGRTD